MIRAVLLSYSMGLLLMAHLSGCRMQPYKTYCFFDTEAIEGIRSVAVLPFHNLSKQVNAGVIITNMVMAELVQYGKFRVIKYGDLRDFLFQRRMTSVSTIDIETLRTLRQEFKVDAVIMGTVLKYEDGDESVSAGRNKRPIPPSVVINSTILDTRTGRILGQGEFIEKGSARGYLLTNKEREKAFALARYFAQKLVSRIGTHGV